MEKKSLPLSFLLIIGIFTSCGIFTLIGLISLENHNRKIYEHPFTVSKASLQVALDIIKMHRSMKDVVLSDSSEEIEMIKKDLAISEHNIDANLALIHKYILGSEGHALELHAKKLFIEWAPIRKKVFHFLESGNRQKAISITKKEGAEHVNKLENQAIAMTAYAANKAAIILSRGEQEQAKLQKAVVILEITCVLVALVVSFVAMRFVVKSEKEILDKNVKLKNALDEIELLRRIIPICSYCKKIRDDQGSWERVESYIGKHSGAEFSHGLCPECYRKELKLFESNVISSDPVRACA
ncbi:MCP four helix bundle domain-containing protein [Desulfobulbus sp. TB]|nr:MCP four helix bundle domain-containing protein [Desulfobulbus sp. TB]